MGSRGLENGEFGTFSAIRGSRMAVLEPGMDATHAGRQLWESVAYGQRERPAANAQGWIRSNLIRKNFTPGRFV